MAGQDLKTALIQTSIFWKEKHANYAALEEKIWSIDDDTDLIVLPEMFNTGFCPEDPGMGEHPNLTTFKWMLQMAQMKKCAIMGSYMVNDEGEVYNRMVMIDEEGQYSRYDKKHLFSFAEEHRQIQSGTLRPVFQLKGWRIFPAICYDLRFPVWLRNDCAYDLLITVANWPEARVDAWKALLKARAIENVAYVCGVNRVGKDGNDIPYNGHSAIFDFKGQRLNEWSEKEEIITQTLDKKAMLAFREKFPVLEDRDKFSF